MTAASHTGAGAAAEPSSKFSAESSAEPSAELPPETGDHVALAERVADILRDRVVRGALAPGDRIVERRLCAELNVSRTPMREALKLLAQDGLVEISKNRGARVAAYGAAEATDLFDVIGVLESLAAERFCVTAAAAQLQALEALHARMLATHRARALDQYFDLNSQIHDLIVDGSGNPVLIESRRRLIIRARRGRYMAIMDRARWNQAVGEHEALMDTLRRRDAGAAAEIWRAHLSNTGVAVADALCRRTSGA